MYPSINTQSVPTISTKIFALFPYSLSYVIQTSFGNTINALFIKLNDNSDKQDEKLEFINILSANHNDKIDGKH